MTTIEEIEKRKRIIKNIESMNMSVLDELDTHVTINGGLSIDELVKTIHFHKFTPDSLAHIFKQINQNPNTYHGIGPFLFRDGGWYNIRERKLDVIRKLTEENMRLKKENEELTKKIKWREEVHTYSYV
tara:strand:+ start:2262 stop:2648 length:387 start_codon:yes stop_codon:yes gene_type:complete